MQANISVAATGIDISLVAVAAFLPLFLSFASALRKSVEPGNTKHFFLYDGGLDIGKFVTGSVGYSMQVASIYLFLLWFQTYGAWALIVPAAWFAGYVLLAIMVRLKLLDRFLAFQSDSVVTIHGYVAEAFGGRRWLAKCLAITTICGLGGTMLAEIDYALTYFVFPALTLTPPKGPYAVIVFVLMLLTAGSYIMWGGYKAAIDTDVIQVKVAYGLIAVVIAALSLSAAKSGNSALTVAVAASVVVFYSYAANQRRHLSRLDPSYKGRRVDMGIFYGLAAIVAGTAAVGWFLRGGPKPGVPVGTAVFAGSSVLPLGYGAWGFVALLVTNVLWQLIDVSALQRLQSLKFNPKATGEHKKLADGLIAAGLEGTGSWGLVLVLAILLKSSGVEGLNILSALEGAWLLIPAFIYVVMAFMLSTLDTLIAASGYVFHYDGTRDLLPVSTRDDKTELRWARRGTMTCLVLVGALYYVIRMFYGDDPAKLSTIVYAIYAVQASIIGPVLVAILAPVHRRNVWFCVGGLVAGWLAAMLTTIGLKTPIFGMPLDSWYVFPPFAALAISAVTSLVGCMFINKKPA